LKGLGNFFAKKFLKVLILLLNLYPNARFMGVLLQLKDKRKKSKPWKTFFKKVFQGFDF
jgi:hypothetical protein